MFLRHQRRRHRPRKTDRPPVLSLSRVHVLSSLPLSSLSLSHSSLSLSSLALLLSLSRQMTVRCASISRNSKTTTELTFPKYFVSREGVFGALTVVKGWMREVEFSTVSLSHSLSSISLSFSLLSLCLSWNSIRNQPHRSLHLFNATLYRKHCGCRCMTSRHVTGVSRLRCRRRFRFT